MGRWRLNTIGIGLALVMAVRAEADVVTTSDGSRIVGTVERVADGKLVILTRIAGRLEIDVSKVTGISTDRAFHVALGGGDTVVGPMGASPEGDTIVVRSKLGDVSIAPSRITLLWPAGTEDPRIIERREKAQARIGKVETLVLEDSEGMSVIGRTKREAPEIDAIVRLPRSAARKGQFIEARLTGYDAFEFTADVIARRSPRRPTKQSQIFEELGRL